MKSRLASVRTLTTALLGAATLICSAGIAAAQPALDDDEEMPASTTESSPSEEDAPWDSKAHIGVGLRLRNVIVPQGLVEIFVDRAAGGSSEFGFGIEVSRRNGNFEVQFGLEYEAIHIDSGLWIDKGDSPVGGPGGTEPDLVEFENFGWITAEATFLNHTPIAKQFALRYGGGAGIAIMKGQVVRTDYRCVSADLDSCDESPAAENISEPYDIPPVMLVVNAIIGVQIRPIESVFINIEGGLRTIPFFGITGGYYF